MVWYKGLVGLINRARNFLKSNIYFLTALLLLAVFYISLRLKIYNLLVWEIFNGKFLEGHLTDQLLFVYIFLFLFSLGVLFHKITIKKIDLVVFLLLFSFLLIFNSETLYVYFRIDDYLVLLGNLLHPVNIHEAYSGKRDFFYYQFMPFSLLFYFFKHNAFFYNLISSLMMAVSGIILLRLLNFLSTNFSSRNFVLAFTFSLFFLINPVYMDIYVYLQNFTATGFILTFLLSSIYLYLLFFRKNDPFYFLLSFVCILILLKTAFVRAGYLPALLIILEVLHFRKNLSYILQSFLRIILITVAFLLIAWPYVAPTTDVRLYGISTGSLINFDRLYLVFSNQIAALIPNQLLSPLYEYVTGKLSVIFSPAGFIYNNIFFLSAIIFDFIFLAVTLTLVVLKKTRIQGLLILFFFTAAIISLTFFMLFGNVAKSARHSSYDVPLILYGATPGSRYYVYPLAFFLTSFFLMFLTLTEFLKWKLRYFIHLLIILSLIVLIVSNIRFTNLVLNNLNKGNLALSYLIERVKSMIPDDNNYKVFYSTNGTIRIVQFLTFDGFLTLYKNRAPAYLATEKDLLNYLNKYGVKKEDFYAVYYDENTKEFIDQSVQYRLKYESFLSKD